MADENGDYKGAKLEDSNMANYGGKDHRAAMKAAAASDKEFAGAGQKVGLEIWRVENRRTEKDTPDFGVKRWPKEEYGSFHSGDSYLVLNTYRVKDENGKDTDKLGWDVHFWLGSQSSQDEIGVAAYKAVELDDLLDDGPVQHREVQYEESKLFQSYFGDKGLRYMEGGIASGFRHVKPAEYKPRLFQVKRTAKTIRAWEVNVAASSLNHGDVFVLDAGIKVYTFIGEFANAFEKLKGGQMVHAIVAGRLGKSKSVPDLDDEFWKILGGSAADVKPAADDEDEENPKDAPLDANKCQLWRLSDATGSLKFDKVKEGKLTAKDFDSNDVFVVDAVIEVFVWVGKGASQAEKTHCMKYAQEYLKHNKKPETTPITRIKDGQVHHVFGSLLAADTPRPQSTMVRRESNAPKLKDLISADKQGQKITGQPLATPEPPKFAQVGLKKADAAPAASRPAPAAAAAAPAAASSGASSGPAWANKSLKSTGDKKW